MQIAAAWSCVIVRHLQCDPGRPDVHFEPWKGVQAVGDLGWLEGRRALTRSTGVILRKRVESLDKRSDITRKHTISSEK